MKLTGRLAEFIEDWKYMVKRDGVFRALSSIGLDIVKLPYRHLRFLVIARSLDEPFPDYSPGIPLEIRQFEQADLKYVREINRPSEARQCARRMEHGHKGLVAIYKGKLAGYAWACVEIDPQLEKLPIVLEPGDILCNDMFTNPAFRGQGIQTELSLARFKLFRNLGLHRAICYIEISNLPSLNVWQKKLGGLILGRIDFIRIVTYYRVRYIKTNFHEC